MRRIATLNDNGDPSSSIATPSRLHKEVLLFTEAAPTWFRLVSAQLGLHQSRPMIRCRIRFGVVPGHEGPHAMLNFGYLSGLLKLEYAAFVEAYLKHISA